MRKKYALITGASEGLGKHLAIECASSGYHLVLAAMPGSGIQKVADAIRRIYSVNVMIIEEDLSFEEGCYTVYNCVKQEQIELSVLINNAGVGGTFFFGERDPSHYTRMITLNTITPTILCRLFLDDLKKASGYIMNVSSMAGMFHLPKKQVYGATKSFLLSFSESLRQECSKHHVSVSVLCPGGMNTNWRITVANRSSGTSISRMSIMDPCDVAAIGIRGMLAKKAIIVPGLLNKGFLMLNRLIPVWLKERMLKYQMVKDRRVETVELVDLQKLPKRLAITQ